ncbi:MAG: selenium-binding protein SBP56-related protein [Candidatus Entotheonellia bacterium]
MRKLDPTLYLSPRLAMQAPAEGLAYVATCQVNGQPDALWVVDLAPHSPSYGQMIDAVDLPYVGDEIHHLGWNACSSALSPFAPSPSPERRYLVVAGLRSSRIYILDTKPDPRQPRLLKTVAAEELTSRTGYTRPYAVRCGPEGIYISALGAGDGDGPGGLCWLDHENFEASGPWEVERGPQWLSGDVGWHVGHGVGITSEWGPPSHIENGLRLVDVVNRCFGHRLHLWDLHDRRHLQALELGDDYQMVLALRPAHHPASTYGFVGVVISVQDLSSSVWLWYREARHWALRKIITIPAEDADPRQLPPIPKVLQAVPPLLTDLNLSLDDRFLYMSCWGSGELRQYDVSDPLSPRLASMVRLGGIGHQAFHPRGGLMSGGPQMIEVSRDGRRVYVTNSFYSRWDDQFYPGFRGWMVKLQAHPAGGLTLDPGFFVDFGEGRPHQIRLQGGDSSSDSFCYDA